MQRWELGVTRTFIARSQIVSSHWIYYFYFYISKTFQWTFDLVARFAYV